MTTLAAVIVNYESGELALGCASSVRTEWLAAGRAERDLRIVVVDNASRGDPSDALARLFALGARVLRSATNLGYARGVHFALQREALADVYAVLNPDLYFLPGSLEPLLEHAVRERGLGAVGPSTFVDPACALALPPNELPSLAGEWSALVSRLDPRVALAAAQRRTRAALAAWSATSAREVEMLSGACLFFPRAALARLGALLDTRYPLYYEDTDLARRARAAGLALIHEPRSRVVHHWARSSGVGAACAGEVEARWRASREAYFRRWHGAFGAAFVRALDGSAQRWPQEQRDRALHPLRDLGPCASAARLAWPRACEFVFELALTPHFALAAGTLGTGSCIELAPATWEWLFPARYFARALERSSGALLGAWSFEKLGAARGHALSPFEVQACRSAA